MNKMVKGAIATGVGAILLVGGGGTLATWNQSSDAATGTVVAGDLNMVPVTASAKWVNASGTTVDVTKYKVVPGDTLTYTQELDVTLSGDLMVAKLTAVNDLGTGDFGKNATVSATTLTSAEGVVLPDTLLDAKDSGKVLASTTFTFNQSTGAQDATNKSLDLGKVSYTLTQQAPASSNGL